MTRRKFLTGTVAAAAAAVVPMPAAPVVESAEDIFANAQLQAYGYTTRSGSVVIGPTRRGE